MRPDTVSKDLADFRLQQAKTCLQGAERELIAEAFGNAANRSYYCIFNAMRAVLALDRFDSKRHSGIISVFHKDYIKTKIFPVEFSEIIDSAFQIRNKSDYVEFYIVEKEKVVTQTKNAELFLNTVEKYIGGIVCGQEG